MNIIQNTLKYFVVGAAIVAVTTVSISRPAQADTASTAAIVAGAAAIVGALLLDGNKQPYYIHNNRKYYVTQPEARYWQAHHQTVVRRAYVPENEYPVARNAGYRIPEQQQHGNNQSRGNQGH